MKIIEDIEDYQRLLKIIEDYCGRPNQKNRKTTKDKKSERIYCPN